MLKESKIRLWVPSMTLALLSSACGLHVVDVGAASMAKRMPVDNKDAYFLSPPSFYGVFDGVSQGPASREYARTLARESDKFFRGCGGSDGSWNEQARNALLQGTEKASGLSGMSTVLLLRVDLERRLLCTYSIGDCCALLLRECTDGCSFELANVSGVTYHHNGAPYQLAGSNWISDSVDDGDTKTFDVDAGDIVLGFSDGVTGNLAFRDVARIVSGCADESADAIAQAIVQQARAAGRVADDITVVVVRLGSGESDAVAELCCGPYYPIIDEAGDSASLGIGPVVLVGVVVAVANIFGVAALLGPM